MQGTMKTLFRGIDKLVPCLRYFLPVKWPQLCVSEMCTVLRAGWMLGEPGTNACPAEDMLTRRHHSILTHTPTHTAQQALVDVAHKPLNIIPHSMETHTHRERECEREKHTMFWSVHWPEAGWSLSYIAQRMPRVNFPKKCWIRLTTVVFHFTSVQSLKVDHSLHF